MPLLLDLQGERDERDLIRRLMAVAQLIVTAIVDGQLPQQTEGPEGVAVPDDQLVTALAQLRALAEALADGSATPSADPAPAPTPALPTQTDPFAGLESGAGDGAPVDGEAHAVQAADAPPPAASFTASAEAELLALLDAERARVGLPGLALDGGLQAAAATQAANIAAAGSLYHQDLVPLLGPWRTAGQNVGCGPSVGTINSALVNSPGHHANMVNPQFTDVGIGVVVTPDGRVWVSQVLGA